MNFIETKLPGVYVLEPRVFEDERGLIAPAFSAKEFAAHGMESVFVESIISFSRHRGTLRGLHYQAPPFGQAKLVRCTRGTVYDVAVDLRPSSPTFKQWFGVELSAKNRRMMYLPGDCGHGFLTLADDSEVFYMVSEVYSPESGRGVRWNDPAFGIEWPDVEKKILIERDEQYPDFNL
ncbi:MAG TPA: dTDP-4-dehydrorhamnose 3,5-epimerase [Pyrinomonadaceae bacterium]|nr:dTDP-4-dehydrorhamnose 3,5-epimerase [Pyrinomonadaceae bacterium]